MKQRQPGGGRAALLGLALLFCRVADASALEPRIVTVGGSITEIVYALGYGSQVVAVDTTSYYPDAASRLPKVGYQRQLSAEGILSIRPDVIVSVADAGPPRTFDQLRDAGARLQLIADRHSAAGVEAKIREVAAAIGAPERGKSLADSVGADLAQILPALDALSPRRRVLFLLAPSRGAPLASGGGTAADAMIRLAGAENAIKGYHGYKPLSVEAAIASEPEAILMMSQSVDQIGGRVEVLKLAPITAIKAGREGRLVVLDGIYLLGFGPRTAHAVRDLASQLYPDLRLPPLPEREWVKTEPAQR